jgi:hypothetical protein
MPILQQEYLDINEYLTQNFKNKTIYSEQPKICYQLKNTYKYQSKSQIIPFVVSEECNETYFDQNESKNKTRTRKFLVFHDVIHYLHFIHLYHNSHEVMHGVNEQVSFSGRLVFDFDIKDDFLSMNGFNDQLFHEEVRKMVFQVFHEFYTDIDTSKLHDTWLFCEHEDKYSRHVIYKNAIFCEDWIKQLKIFYNLCKYIIERDSMFQFLTDRISFIDDNIARNNATLRLPFNSKLSGKPLLIENYNGIGMFFDSLIQYHEMNEQKICNSQLNKEKLFKMFSDKSSSMFDSDNLLQFFQTKTLHYKKSQQYLDKVFKILDWNSYHNNNTYSNEINTENINKVLKIIENNKYITNMFTYNVSGNFINLNRKQEQKCFIGSKIHKHRGMYILVLKDSIRLYCRNPCCKTSNNSKYIDFMNFINLKSKN